MKLITQPTVELWAQTATTADLDYHLSWGTTEQDAEHLVEAAGRSCYQSFHRPSPATADTGNYLRRTVFEQGHGSITEHAVVTFYLQGVSRSLTHELVRHRHLSYSQLSQRFVDEADAAMVVPPAIRDLEGEAATRALRALRSMARDGLAVYKGLVGELTDAGLPRKQAREAARAVLPNCTETKIVVTGNLRAWAEFIDRRAAPDADAEIQAVAREIRRQLHEHVSPNLFPIPDEEGQA